MKAVVLSPTRGLGRAIARELAARGARLFLLGRDAAELERSAADLEARSTHAIRVEFAHLDLSDPDGFAPALDAADEVLDGFDTVVVTAALLGTAEQLETDPGRAATLLAVNFSNTILFCEEARRRLLARGGGTLCVLSSVAGDRARKGSFLYGATKAGLSHYLETLDLRYRTAGLKTVAVRPGFVRTSMTAGLPEPPFAADPEPVARRVVKAIERGWPVVYAPPVWRLILLAVRMLPRWVMRRVSF